MNRRAERDHMTRGQKITILIIAGLIAIGLIIYFIILPIFPKAAPPVNTNANQNINALVPFPNTNNQAPVTNVPPPADASPAAVQASAARTVVLAFAERLATYTNQNDLSNFSDLEAFSTPAVWKYIIGEYREKLLKSMPDQKNYYAVTSSAINSNITPVSDTQVNAKILLQRVETGTVANTSYATLDLVLKKIGDDWLVARLDWEK